MKRKICLIVILVVALSTSVALGFGNIVQRVPAGAVAFHFVGNLESGELFGYIAFIEGVEGDLFSGVPGVGTAHFTVRLDPTTAPGYIPLPVDEDSEAYVKVALIPPGYEFSVYFDKNPDGSRNWGNPETFAVGKRVATFQESALLSTHIIDIPDEEGMGYNLFSSRLISSKGFWFNGQWVDFKRLVPYGVTINNVTSEHMDSTAFGASAVAIGWRR